MDRQCFSTSVVPFAVVHSVVRSSRSPLLSLTPSQNEIPRCQYLMDATRSVLVVVDVQEKLISKIVDHEKIVPTISRVIDAARSLGIPILVSEQYPERLGATIPELAAKLPPADSKRMFSCRELWPLWSERLQGKSSEGSSSKESDVAPQLDPPSLLTQRDQWILCGIESHVCILQTAMDLLSLGCNPVLIADAISARSQLDHDLALRRMESAGIQVATSESVLFEWCETSLHPKFKTISEIVKSR